ncbi:hypothetical protein RI129_009132 [Pyrocoelia pectoralis]|uniref:LITAF domain-containing protein n=1 Tax=Pyrocoelia pectoralis TaxID=417401 RepID=A0AAN7ZEC8_9COLE
MEKVPPPSYQESMHPPPGINPPQGYPSPMHQPTTYPMQHPQQIGFQQPHQMGFQQPQQPGFQQPQAPQVVMVSPPTVFGPNPLPLTCAHCHKQVTSRVQSESATKTHLFALILCLVGCIPCCLIPYCMDSCQSQNHYCSHCNAFLGSYNNQ